MAKFFAYKKTDKKFFIGKTKAKSKFEAKSVFWAKGGGGEVEGGL